MEPTKEWIEENKKKYGKLAKTTIGTQSYIYRTLKRPEHLAIQKEVFPTGVPVDQVRPEDNAVLEDKIVLKCVLWPENLDLNTLDAGVVTALAPSILFVSGFVNPPEPEEL